MSTVVVDELIDLSDSAIDDELRSVELQARALADRHATLIAVADHRGLFRADGHRTMAGYLRATCNWSNPTIARIRRRAALIDAAPVVGDALRLGRVSVCAVDVLADAYTNARIADYVVRVIDLFVDHAEHLSLAELKIRVDEFVTVVDVDGSFDETREHVNSRNAWVVETAGGVDITATGGDPIAAARLVGVFERFCNIEYHNDVDTRRARFGDDADHHDLARTAPQRRFDAIVNMINTANTH
jgi:hypothetical protein